MLEISISRELAAAHSGFMASCAQRGHAVDVFDNDGADTRETDRSAPDLSCAFETEASRGDRTQDDKDPTA
jgi:hypothetical protein